MKFRFLILLLFISYINFPQVLEVKNNSKKIALVIHGGAGIILKNGESSIDAVEK